MYEKDGKKYFVVDSHLHLWDASPENWVKGSEAYAKGWIECFHAYQSLGPPETLIYEYPMADDSWAVEYAAFIEDIDRFGMIWFGSDGGSRNFCLLPTEVAVI